MLRHSAEKMSFFKLVLMARFLLSFFIDTSFLFNDLFLQLGLLLPFSRKAETEADKVSYTLYSKAHWNDIVIDVI